MRRVIIESPWAGDTAANAEYLRRCLVDSLGRGEAPFASHRMYTSALDDADPEQRERGILAGYAWAADAAAAVLYVDRGISQGMADALRRHARAGIDVDVRALDRAVTGIDWQRAIEISGQLAGVWQPQVDGGQWRSALGGGAK